MVNAKRSLGYITAVAALALVMACGLIDPPTPIPTIARTPDPTATDESDPDCTRPLDDETLNRLIFSLGALSGARDLLAGGTYPITLGVVDCCYIFQPVQACATWTVEPPDGLQIDPVTGAMEISPDVPGGSEFTLSADIEDGRRIISETIYIFTYDSHPLVRTWSEMTQLAC